MKDPMTMTDEEFHLFQARQRAAQVYRAAGYDAFAGRVELGLEDRCSQMRLARFFIEPSPAPSEEFIRAWDEFAAADASSHL
jgi:hypothetical protein